METPLSISQIASAALQFWDMNAEESESEHTLKMAVARDLAELGVDPDVAALAASLVNAALNAQLSTEEVEAQGVTAQPLYQAMLAEIQSGDYGGMDAFE